MVKPTQQQIDKQLNLADKGFERGTSFPGMSYEEGVKNAIEWIMGYTQDAPLDEDESD